MLTASQLKSLLATHGLRLTKRLGQHHLIDPRMIQRIVESAQLSPQDTVVEIGAGLGALTEPLAERAGYVIAVEVDRRISALLAERLAGMRHTEVAHEDILSFNWGRARGAIVVGAIPYQVTSPIIVSLCEQRGHIPRAILIIQEEVAQRFVAKPGAKTYGRLSVLGQYCWEIRMLFRVPRSAFFPQPAVDSSCVEFTARPQPAVRVDDEAVFFRVVKAAFAQRRKTLVNCLSAEHDQLVDRAEAEALVRHLDLPETVRGETLSLDQFAALANALARSNSLR